MAFIPLIVVALVFALIVSLILGPRSFAGSFLLTLIFFPVLLLADLLRKVK